MTASNSSIFNATVSIVWIPHKNISGNDRADMLAKWAATSEWTEPRTREWQSSIRDSRQTSIEKWRILWTTYDLRRFFHSISPIVGKAPKFYDCLNRPEVRMVCLIVAHIITPVWETTCIDIVESALCKYCNLGQYESIDHVLFNCQGLQHERRQRRNRSWHPAQMTNGNAIHIFLARNNITVQLFVCCFGNKEM